MKKSRPHDTAGQVTVFVTKMTSKATGYTISAIGVAKSFIQPSKAMHRPQPAINRVDFRYSILHANKAPLDNLTGHISDSDQLIRNVCVRRPRVAASHELQRSSVGAPCQDGFAIKTDKHGCLKGVAPTQPQFSAYREVAIVSVALMRESDLVGRQHRFARVMALEINGTNQHIALKQVLAAR
jgi:hypothetical protein